MLGIGAWFAAHLHLTPVRQQEISASLRQAHEQTCAAIKDNMRESERTIATPTGQAQTGIMSLLYQIEKVRKGRREKPH